MPPDLATPAHTSILPRLRDIERRLRRCMARGEQPTTALLADALHVTASALLLIVEAEERIAAAEDAAARRELRYLAAEERMSSLADRIEQAISVLPRWLVRR